MRRSLLAGCLVFLINTAYLAVFSNASLWHYTNVALHPLLGGALAVGFAWLIVRRRQMPLSALERLAAVVLAAGGVLGLAVAVLGATRSHWTIVQAHVAVSILGLAVVPFSRIPTSVRVAVIAACLVIGSAPLVDARREAERREMYRITNPTTVPASMSEEGSGPAGPFFPSSADTTSRGIIPANFFLTSQTCARCHREIYDQWNSSMHHFSSFNNQWYRKSVEYMQDVIGTKPSKWCAGCHDHAVFFNGRFDRPIKEQIDTPEAQAGLACTSCHAITHVKSTMGQGDFDVEYPPLHDFAASNNPVLQRVHDTLLMLDPKPHRETFLKPFHREQTPEFCSTCHKVHLDVPVNAYRWFRGFNDYDNWQASGVSGEGARSFYYPARSQKCADCHMPLVDSSDPAAKNGKVRSHRFAAANTALPFVNGDATQLKAAQGFLKDGQISVDVFGIVRSLPRRSAEGAEAGGIEGVEGTEGREARRAEGGELASMFAVGEESAAFGARHAVVSPPSEVIGPFGAVPITVKRGESVRLEVVVRTRKVGHFFPGGTVDAFDVWVELDAVDDRGRPIFQSGARANGNGPVDPGAHFYRSLLIDEHGNRINKRNAWAARSVAYVRLIPPGAADTIHYRLDIPPEAGDRITLTARVNYRKFAWWNTQWAFAGVRDPSQPRFALAAGHDDGPWIFTGDTAHVSGGMKAIPDLPVTVMAESRATLNVVPAGATPTDPKPVLQASLRERWNDYGIGLLLQGDIKAAEAAFLHVTQMEPGYADGWVNVGRARLQEGNVQAAAEVLRKALEVDPELAKSHFFLAMALKALGQYDDAITHLRTAAAKYPRDRVVVNQLGRVLFLKRSYRDAIAEFQRVLAIDAEDLFAHYNLMLCYQGLGDTARAARERTLYERFKADESSQAITGEYRLLNPEDNNERQSIHEHRSGRRP